MRRWCCGRSRAERQARERERAGRPRWSSSPTALEAGLAFPGGGAVRGEVGAVVASRASSPASTAASARASSRRGLDELARAPERAAASAAAILRAAFVDLPTGGVAPVLRELARVLRERWETRERARTRALSLQREAAILAVSPMAFVLLIGASLARLPGRLPQRRPARWSV